MTAITIVNHHHHRQPPTTTAANHYHNCRLHHYNYIMKPTVTAIINMANPSTLNNSTITIIISTNYYQQTVKYSTLFIHHCTIVTNNSISTIISHYYQYGKFLLPITFIITTRNHYQLPHILQSLPSIPSTTNFNHINQLCHHKTTTNTINRHHHDSYYKINHLCHNNYHR